MFRSSISAAAALAATAVIMAPAAAQEVTDAEAEAAITAWLQAIMAGPEALETVLAPEFQIQRFDGTGYDRAGYIGGGLASISEIHGIRDLTVTVHGDLLVTRYILAVGETINGAAIEREAPRLTVFRRDGDAWLVVAHANFAQLQD